MEKVVDNELKFNTFNPQLLRGYNLEKKFHLLLKEVIKICLQKVK
jgi:hypothetical protein